MLGTILILICSSEKITLWCTFSDNLIHNYSQHDNVGEPYKNKTMEVVTMDCNLWV
jgi:hypothetical protein